MPEFKLPELGENVHTGTVVRVMVAAGKPVAKDQAVVEVETDKAAIEVPSTVSGTVRDVLVKAGDKVSPGAAIFTYEGAAGAAAPRAGDARGTVREENGGAAAPARPKHPAPQAGAPAPRPAAPPPPEGELPEGAVPGAASPSVRRLARELGVDLARVRGTGRGGRISADDLKDYLRRSAARAAAPAGAPAAPRAPALPDFAKWGPVERQAMSSIRRATAEHLSTAWANIPQVTQHDKADVTEFDDLRKRHSKPDAKITMTSLAVKIVAAALKRYPQFNASVDMAGGAIVYKKYCHVGVAVDTDRGLLVPVIRDADKKSLLELSREISEAAKKARDKKLSLDDMRGGSFTVTNLGGIGGVAFSPIVNWPEVAILGISRGAMEPVWIGGAFQPRLRATLSLSYDHRLIDGADGARFLRFVCEAIEQPMLLAFEGLT